MTWNCMVCQYTKGVYEWRQVYSHVMAVRRYESRIPNERWNIPLDQQYKPECNEEKINPIYLNFSLFSHLDGPFKVPKP